MNKKIYISLFGDIDSKIVKKLAFQLGKEFNLKVKIGRKIDIPSSAYNKYRNQYLSPILLSKLKQNIPSDAFKILGIVDVDLYVPQLNFIFGQAELNGKVAIISLTRLRQEYYGLKPDNKLFELRILKEAIHELGHCFGLNHCSNSKCVMHFSNSLRDTDYKSHGFCSNCKRLLRKEK
jgi:archaemetzincin